MILSLKSFKHVVFKGQALIAKLLKSVNKDLRQDNIRAICSHFTIQQIPDVKKEKKISL